MSIENALIARARPYMLKKRLDQILEMEACKGCLPDLSPMPVALEPVFHPIRKLPDLLSNQNLAQFDPEPATDLEDLARQEVWLSPEQAFDCLHAERFLKQLSEAGHRAGLEILGNQEGIHVCLLSHEAHRRLVKAAFDGEFRDCCLSDSADGLLTSLPAEVWDHTVFRDYFPPPPYSHLLTRPAELHFSPFEPFIVSLADMPPPTVGFCQVLFQPVSPENNWHENVERLLDIEYSFKLADGSALPQRFAQQAPSGELRSMSMDTENKAHSDKPFFCAALRVGIASPTEFLDDLLMSISSFTGLFLHGGRPLRYLTDRHYLTGVPGIQPQNIFLQAMSYHPGFLLNSLELAGLVHLPSVAVLSERNISIPVMETLLATNPELSNGTPTGENVRAGTSVLVCIPPPVRSRHTHVLGKTSMGKTFLIESMILDDIEKGFGVAVLDPHGDLIKRLLRLIGEKDAERTIYFNPGDPEWVPVWNPFARIPGQDIDRTASELVAAIKNYVGKDSWGDRMENILKHIIFSVLHLPGSNLMDVLRLLYNQRKGNQKYIDAFLPLLTSQSAELFWEVDFKKYRRDEMSPPKNKLSKLLLSEKIELMLSQPESRFNLLEIMNNGNVLLIDLSMIGPTYMRALGCLFVSLFHVAAISRSSVPEEQRKDFHLYCDEAQLFISDSYESLISETRKFNVYLTLAHQYLSQFDRPKVDALGGVGTTISFCVNKDDAFHLSKGMQDMVDVKDLVALEPREAIARINTDVVKIKTLPAREIPATHFQDRIIDQSRQQYYKRRSELRKNTQESIAPRTFAPPHATTGSWNELKSPEAFRYDEFC